MRRPAPPSHRLPTPAAGRRRFVALGERCVAGPVLVSGGLAALHAALRAIPSRRAPG